MNIQEIPPGEFVTMFATFCLPPFLAAVFVFYAGTFFYSWAMELKEKRVAERINQTRRNHGRPD